MQRLNNAFNRRRGSHQIDRSGDPADASQCVDAIAQEQRHTECDGHEGPATGERQRYPRNHNRQDHDQVATGPLQDRRHVGGDF